MTRAPFRNQPLLSSDEVRERLGEFYDAVDQFNRRWYFESHETLEDLWMLTPWPERQFFQAIIQLAAAFVHYARGDYDGIFKLLEASEDKLREFTPECFGVDTAGLLEEITRVRAEFEAAGPGGLREWDEGRAPTIVYCRQ